MDHDPVAALSLPAVVVGRDGRIESATDGWIGLTPPEARRGVTVGVGADYLGACRRAAAAGDADAAAAARLVEGVMDGTLASGEVVYPCPSPDQHRWFRLIATRAPGPVGRALLVHVPTDPPARDAGGADAGLLHDIANQLQVAAGWLELVGRGDGRATTELVDRGVQVAAAHVARAVELLAEARSVAPAPAPVPVLGIAAAAAERVEALDVELDLDADLHVRCDPRHLRRVFDNLFDNAASYGTSPVVVEGERRGRRVELRVRDAGGGVPRDIAPLVFESGVRAPEHAGISGTGAGLAIVRALLRLDGGTIRLDPDDPAAFVIDLPAAEDDATPGLVAV